MSAEKTTKRATRKATFLVEEIKGQRVYRPVNKRAHKWAHKVGKRTRLLKEDVSKIKATGRVKIYVYGNGGVLKALR